MIHVTRAMLIRGLERLLHTHDTQRRTALAFGLGVFIGFSPLLGLHTALGILLAFALNLNRVAVLLGVYTNLPWFLAPYYTLATLGGAALLGTRLPPGLLREIRVVLSHWSPDEMRQFLTLLQPLVWAFTIGSTLGALVLAGTAYGAAVTFIHARRRWRTGAGQS